MLSRIEICGIIPITGSSGRCCESGVGMRQMVRFAGILMYGTLFPATLAHGQAIPSGIGTPYGLIEANDGLFYAMTDEGYVVSNEGGVTNCGNCDAYFPHPGIVQGTDGNFFITLTATESYSDGAIGEVYPTGAFTSIYTFCQLAACADGQAPVGALAIGSDGNFYGVTKAGGANDSGTIFRVTPSGSLTTLAIFTGSSATENNPGSLLAASDGNFYGTIGFDDQQNAGYLLQITPSGAEKGLWYFGEFDTPASVIEGPNQTLYGAAPAGGAYGYGYIFTVNSSGTFTDIHDFCAQSGCPDGAYPTGLYAAGDGNLYGGTLGTGTGSGSSPTGPTGTGPGTLFKITPTGTLTTLTTFCATSVCTDSIGVPNQAPIEDSNGNLWFTTELTEVDESGGGIYTFTMPTPLPPPVELTLSASAIKLGQSITLTWTVTNAFDAQSKQCFSTSSDSEWNTTETSEGSTTLTPKTTGTITYSLTCGGRESGFATVTVDNATLKATTTIGGSSPAVIYAGQNTSVDLYATVTPQASSSLTPTGTVTFYYESTELGKATLASGEASTVVSSGALPVGTYDITAGYSGDTNFAASVSQPYGVVVETAPPTISTTTSLSVAPLFATQGQSVTLQANVTSKSGTPAGTVAFYANGGEYSLGNATLGGGVATLALVTSTSVPAESYQISAQYLGNSTYLSSSTSYTTVVIRAATTTKLTITPNPVPVGGTATISVKVAEVSGTNVPTGTVLFSSGSTSLGSAQLNGAGDATLTVNASSYPAGTYAVVAAYEGDNLDGASTSSAVNVTVK